MCIVLALEADVGPNTQDKALRVMVVSDRFFKDLMATLFCWRVCRQVIQHSVGLPTALEAIWCRPHLRDLRGVFMKRC